MCFLSNCYILTVAFFIPVIPSQAGIQLSRFSGGGMDSCRAGMTEFHLFGGGANRIASFIFRPSRFFVCRAAV
jgi:hypothetical protein